MGGTVTVISRLWKYDSKMSRMPELPSKIWQIRSWSRKGKMMKTLKEVKCGETVKATKTYRSRSGNASWTWELPKGTDVLVRKVAPLGDPIADSKRL